MYTLALALLIAVPGCSPTAADTVPDHPLIGTWTCRRDSLTIYRGDTGNPRYVHLREAVTFEADGQISLISQRDSPEWTGEWKVRWTPIDTTFAAYTSVDTIYGLWKAGPENVAEGAPLLIEWKTPKRWPKPPHPVYRDYTPTSLLRVWYWEESRVEIAGELSPWVLWQIFGRREDVEGSDPYWHREPEN